MRFSILLLVGSVILYGGYGADLAAQSLKSLVMALPLDVHTLGEGDALESLFSMPVGVPFQEAYVASQPDKDSHSRPLFGQLYPEEDFSITKRTAEELSVKWDDGTSITLAKLPISRRESVLMVLRTVEDPFELSTVSFYNADGERQTSYYGLPHFDATLFVELGKITHKDIASIKPTVVAKYDVGRKTLSLRLSTKGALSPIEVTPMSEQPLEKNVLRFRWKRGGFVQLAD